MILPYKQFNKIEFLSKTERFNINNKTNIPYRFKESTNIWNSHIKKNKYFDYKSPLNSQYYKETYCKKSCKKNFKNIKKKDIKKKDTKKKNLLYMLYKINFKELDNFNILWNQIYDKNDNNNTNNITWSNFFNNINNNNIFNEIDNFNKVDL